MPKDKFVEIDGKTYKQGKPELVINLDTKKVTRQAKLIEPREHTIDPPGRGGEKIPSWAKQLLENQKAMQRSIISMQEDINFLKEKQIENDRKFDFLAERTGNSFDDMNNNPNNDICLKQVQLKLLRMARVNTSELMKSI